MLCLNRNPGESFVLRNAHGETIATIVVYRPKRGPVKIGIDAPRDISIIRSELLHLPDFRKEPRRSTEPASQCR